MTKTFGPSYDAQADGARIGAQMKAVLRTLLGPDSLKSQTSAWWTLRELEEQTGYPQASLSAQLRHLRKKRFGGYVVEKRRRCSGGITLNNLFASGTYEYRVRRPQAVQLSLIA